MEATTYSVVVEQDPLITTSNMESAIIDLIASYFVFDICYPVPLYSLLIFIQHFVFGLEDTQLVPPNLVEIVTSLKNMDCIL